MEKVKRVSCPQCSGAGTAGPYGLQTCRTCGGRGSVPKRDETPSGRPYGY